MTELINFTSIIVTLFLLWIISSHSIKKPIVNYLFISLLLHSLIFSYLNITNANPINIHRYDGKLSHKSTLKKQNNKKISYKKNYTNTKNKTKIHNNNEIILLTQKPKQNYNNYYIKENLKTLTQKPNENQKKQNNTTHIDKYTKKYKNINNKNKNKNNNPKIQSTLTDTWLSENNNLRQYIYKKEKPFYFIDPNKKGWQKFNFDLSILDNNTELSISGFDEFTHKNYMQHILETVGYKWFYQYAPTEQIALNIMKISTPIIVKFDLDNNGSIKNFNFIQKGNVNVQTEAVKRTFKTVKLEKVPNTLLYRNINMKFSIYPPIRKKNNIVYIKGEIQLDGEVKINR